MNFLGEGGVGSVLSGFNSAAHGFCLKIVQRSCAPKENKTFWNAAKSIQAWTASIRFNAQFVKLPLAQQYWIKASDINPDYRHERQKLSNLIIYCRRREKLGDYQGCPEYLKNVCPEEYILCPDELLNDIYRSDMFGDIRNCSLLITYPVQEGKKTLEGYIKNGGHFSEQDLLDCCYQILTVINDLYQNGCAHRDIKPKNILIDEGGDDKLFRLIDFDAFHSDNSPSNAGTEGFLPDSLIKEELQRQYSPLEFRVCLDCFALAQTLSCMAAGTFIPPQDFSPKLPPLIKKLYRILRFKPSDIQPMLAELEEKYNCKKKALKYSGLYGNNFDFDSEKECYLGELGTFHEQIRFTQKFDPLIRNSSKDFFYYNIPDELSDIIYPLLCEDSCNIYFHAPDDANTGKRPQDITWYTPKSLNNTVLSPKEKLELIKMGKKLNEYFSQNSDDAAFLPEGKQILWVDGKIKILWGRHRLKFPIDYENYFRFLAHEKVDFNYADWRELLPVKYEIRWNASPEYWQRIFDEVVEEYSQYNCKDYSWLYQISEFKEFVISKSDDLSLNNWLCFLPEIPGLENKLTVKVCQQLLMEFSSNKEYAWLFSYSAFRKKIAKETLAFSVGHWLEILKYTHDFDDKIDLETAFAMYQRSGKFRKEYLLQTFPELDKRILEDPEERFRNFCACGKCDEETFLSCFPQEVYSNFNAKKWNQIVSTNPALCQYIPETMYSRLNRKAWVKILKRFPDLIEKCPHINHFSSNEWDRIVSQQPELKKIMPLGITFSD